MLSEKREMSLGMISLKLVEIVGLNVQTSRVEVRMGNLILWRGNTVDE